MPPMMKDSRPLLPVQCVSSIASLFQVVFPTFYVSPFFLPFPVLARIESPVFFDTLFFLSFLIPPPPPFSTLQFPSHNENKSATPSRAELSEIAFKYQEHIYLLICSPHSSCFLKHLFYLFAKIVQKRWSTIEPKTTTQKACLGRSRPHPSMSAPI